VTKQVASIKAANPEEGVTLGEYEALCLALGVEPEHQDWANANEDHPRAVAGLALDKR
jgi:hypothetical protein